MLTCKSFVLLGKKAKTNQTIYQLVSIRIAEDEQPCQVRRPTLKLQLGKNEWLPFFEPLVQMTPPHVALNCLINCPPSRN